MQENQFDAELNRIHTDRSSTLVENQNNPECLTNLADSDVFRQTEIISIDFVLSDEEVIETFTLQDDGSLVPVEEEVPPKKLTRKRKKNYKNWKRNVAKVNRQSGKSYKTAKGEVKPVRNVKAAGCSNPDKCTFKCMEKLDDNARKEIFDSFWNLSDPKKRHFYVSNVKKAKCKRKRTNAEHSRKGSVYNYYFNYMDEDIPVCQQFFNNTLNINKGRVYYYFKQNKNRPTITPGPSLHGKHQKKVISEKQRQEIRDHINRFPVVESHYCRHNSKKHYLYQGLNLAIMYRLYVSETEEPAKIHVYRNIFNYEFNLSFFKPKKDRCDKCMAYEKLNDPIDEQIDNQNLHLRRKSNAYNERTKDREISEIVHEIMKSAIGLFDMENVFQLPISNASTVYYKRKFSVLNLTVFINKIVYCAMWNESLCGREAVHIANALITILKRIVKENPTLEYLTLWSDSCVPQNRNSIMSTAIQYFLDSPASINLQQIHQKFSEPGHGQVQEVDSAHSVIERFLRNKFIYSPPSLLEEISKIPENKLKFIVVPMEEKDYFDYQLLANAYKYSVIPYTKVKQLTYKKYQSSILVKFDFTEDLIEKSINLKPRNIIGVEDIEQLQLHSRLSSEKITDIESLFEIMPDKDKLFYENLFTKSRQLQVNNDGSVAQNITYQKCNQQIEKRKSRLPKVVNSKRPKIETSKFQVNAPSHALTIAERSDTQSSGNIIELQNTKPKLIKRASKKRNKSSTVSVVSGNDVISNIIDRETMIPNKVKTSTKFKNVEDRETMIPKKVKISNDAINNDDIEPNSSKTFSVRLSGTTEINCNLQNKYGSLARTSNRKRKIPDSLKTFELSGAKRSRKS